MRLVILAILPCLILIICGCGGSSSESNNPAEQTVVINESSIELNDVALILPLQLTAIESALGKWDRIFEDHDNANITFYIWDSVGICIEHNSDTGNIIDLRFAFFIECGDTNPEQQFQGTILVENLIVDKFSKVRDFEIAGYKSDVSSSNTYVRDFGNWTVSGFFGGEGNDALLKAFGIST